MFDRFPEPLADPLHAVMARFRADPRPEKMDLGVGVYRDDSGHSPIMAAVKEAEAAILAEEDSKAYQALHGDDRFRSEEHTSELPSLMRISYAVFCLKKKKEEKRSKLRREAK